MKIIFFIRSLDQGGAERQLVITAKGLAARGHDTAILTFYTGGYFSSELNDTPVRLISLVKKGRWDVVGFSIRLISTLRKEAPDIIYSFMSTANISAVLVRRLINPVRIIWGVRSSNVDLDCYDRVSRWMYRLECWLSRFSDRIISNSQAGLEYVTGHGFPRNTITVIPNGIDANRFNVNSENRAAIRKEWGISDNEILIGLIGRLDPMKDHPNFLNAAALLRKKKDNVRFVCVGDGESGYKQSMYCLASSLGLDDVLIWAGPRSDIVAVYNSLDIAASSSSYGEGFSNVIGEMVACGVPCVVTDVGDSALIIGKHGIIVAPDDSTALYRGLYNMLSMDAKNLQTLRQSARDRIVDKFSIDRLVIDTESVLNNL